MKKFDKKFVFEQQFARKTLFLRKYYNDWDSNQVFRLVPTVLHLSAEQSEEFGRAEAEGNLALQVEENII